jgi:trans-aconitate methyltransferase
VSFDLIAPHYHWLEKIAFGNSVQRARVKFLDQIETPKRGLILGEGDGRFLSALLARHPAAIVDCVDASARMLQFAAERLPGKSAVRFLQRDLLGWSPPVNTYDLIVTHFFLDCFTAEEIDAVVAKLAHAALPDASWLIADFAIPQSLLAKVHAQLWLRLMYGFFRLTTGISGCKLIDPGEFLDANGFRLAAQSLQQFGLIKSELWRRM